MRLRARMARDVGLACLWGLKNVLHRNATTLPGRVALALDGGLLSELAGKLTAGSVVVVGTNGKTTTNNVIASVLEASGRTVLCNRIGANMKTGVVTALLPGRQAQWGAFETDEMSTVHVLPELRPTYLLLLDLFPDQLDRVGEIGRVQDAILRALVASGATTLVYNADDPSCEAVARKARAQGIPTIAFGVGAAMTGQAAEAGETTFCQECGTPLAYSLCQYGPLGAYACPKCSFARAPLDYVARNAQVSAGGVSFEVAKANGDALGGVSVPWGGAYMVYNLLAAFVIAQLAGVGAEVFACALESYDPKNGRLQRFSVDGRNVTLNLAKNPVGFNQNVSLLLLAEAPKAVLVMANDAVGDGYDVSWIWDVDFERLAGGPVTRAFVGGHRANDMQVRLKYAGIDATIVENAAGALQAMGAAGDASELWVLANYTALWPVKAELEKMGEAAR